ncbi:MAG: hypothetical protein ABF868_12390 [Sporolactobacillus sp.]
MYPGDMFEIVYQAKDGAFSQRFIRIIAVDETSLKAYCFAKRQVRSFVRERIYASRSVRRHVS